MPKEKFLVQFRNAIYRPSVSFYDNGDLCIALEMIEVLERNRACRSFIIVTTEHFPKHELELTDDESYINVKSGSENFGITDALYKAGVIETTAFTSSDGDGYLWAVCRLTRHFMKHFKLGPRID